MAPCRSWKKSKAAASGLREVAHPQGSQVDTRKPATLGVSRSSSISKDPEALNPGRGTMELPMGVPPLPSPSLPLQEPVPSAAVGSSLNFILKCICIHSYNIYDLHQFFIQPITQLLRRVWKLYILFLLRGRWRLEESTRDLATKFAVPSSHSGIQCLPHELPACPPHFLSGSQSHCTSNI